MDIGSLLVADAQSAKLVEPGKAPAPRPIAVGPARCRAQCYASRARVRCRAHADLSGLPQRRNHGRLPRNQDDSADARALPAAVRWHQQARALAANRDDWLP
jgi:hypothetical protein